MRMPIFQDSSRLVQGDSSGVLRGLLNTAVLTLVRAHVTPMAPGLFAVASCNPHVLTQTHLPGASPGHLICGSLVVLPYRDTYLHRGTL
jgi:hypothetical protein